MIFFYLFCFALVNCTNNVSKEEQLVSSIQSLNDKFLNRNWNAIYEMRVDAWLNGVGNQGGSQKDFENRANEMYLYTYFSVKTLGYNVKNDTAEVKKLIEGRILLPPFISQKIITYDYWIYKNGKWYLSEWNIPEYDGSEPLDTTYVPLVSESELQKYVDSLMKRIEKQKANENRNELY